MTARLHRFALSLDRASRPGLVARFVWPPTHLSRYPHFDDLLNYSRKPARGQEFSVTPLFLDDPVQFPLPYALERRQPQDVLDAGSQGSKQIYAVLENGGTKLNPMRTNVPYATSGVELTAAPSRRAVDGAPAVGTATR